MNFLIRISNLATIDVNWYSQVYYKIESVLLNIFFYQNIKTTQMATNQPTNTPVNQFHLYDIVAKDIADTFNRLIEQLIERRDALLTKLQTMKEDFVTKETTRIAAITELERVIRQMREESIKVNVILKTHEEAIQVYLDEMERHQTPTKLPHPFFSCPTLLHLQTQIAEFGEVREWELDYSLKKQSVLAVGKEGTANNELNEPKGLALDEPNQLIYIADCFNSRIQVVSFAGKFLKRFGQGILERPYGIAVTEDNVFVTDIILHALLQFNKKDYKLVGRTCTYGVGEGQLKYPDGLCIDYNGDVYVADCVNNRVSVFSKDLNFVKHLGTQQLKNPLDVKVTPDSVVVLDIRPNCIHFFSRSGDLLRSCVTQGKDGMVSDPEFFCLDTAGNILISDLNRHSIKILSPSGQLIHKIEKEGHGRGELYNPLGISLSQTGNIFVVSNNSNFALQSF